MADGMMGFLNMRGIGGKIDSTTGVQETITYPHHEIHDGSHYYIEGHATLANAEELRVQLVTPDTTKWAHFLWEISSSNILTTELYEGASGGMAGGSGVTPLNNNRNSANASVMTVTSGVAVATSDGLLVGNGAWGSRSGGETSREREIILKQNTIYLRKFISGAASNIVSFRASWYEHTNE